MANVKKSVEARRLAERAYELFSSKRVDDHVEGMRILADAKQIDARAVTKYEDELSQDAAKGRA